MQWRMGWRLLLAGEPIAADLMNGAEAYLQTWERAVGVPGPSCLAPPRPLQASGFGPLRLDRTAEQTLLSAGQPGRRSGRSFRWCGSGEPAPGAGNAALGAVFDAAGRTELIVSTAAGDGRTAGSRPVAPGLFADSSDPDGTVVWGYSGGELRFSAAATPALAGDPEALLTALAAAGHR